MKQNGIYSKQGMRVLQLLLVLTIILTGCGISQNVGDVSEASGGSFSTPVNPISGSPLGSGSDADASSEDISSEDTSSEYTSSEDTSSEVSTWTSVQSDIPTADLHVDPDGTVSEGNAVSANYFDDAVFIGDSISVMLSYYEASNDRLGKAQFLTASSLGSANAMNPVTEKSKHPAYQGTKMKLQESVPLTGAKKMYIMLGMNDLYFGPQGASEKLTTLVESILASAPDVKVYVQSMTPVATAGTTFRDDGHNYNAVTIKQYNECLAAVCREKGWYFINVASVFADDNGYLIEDYCSDLNGMGIHFTMAGCEKWVDYLYTHAPQ